MTSSNINFVKAFKIAKSNITTADKKTEIAKLGFSAAETAQLICENKKYTRRAVNPADAYTFGVELEVYNVVDRGQMVNEAASRGLRAQYEGYNHRDNSSYYKFVSDSSIEGNNPIECVSPVLTEGRSGYDSIKAICGALKAAGAKVNRSTGYHIHVGGNITDTQYINVFHNYKMLQSVIDRFMPESRRGCRWCRSIENIDFGNCTTPRDVQRALHYDRYYSVNAESWQRHRTIEFRQHSGTINPTKVLNWAKFCIKLVAWSKNNRLTSPVRFIEDIPFITPAEAAYFAERAVEVNNARPVNA